ncbi:tyrosine-type recombinase/integrase [Chitinimonas taiwanensis]|uniref:Phage integrase family protein n=1 Tax=Chitinimonas taiwanensis DSM 18899 TaxID=1121279 RepID=A0A1K2HS72_9NEIS|nr:site-specific integrase [Chitinimonas taiwanensis]SFZ79549.1 Phage integrase family protein [Chitinimonas taiwanensis DSM 18899]
MATIIPIESGDGSKKWRATVRKKRNGKLILNRSKTFSSKKLAEQWATKLEAQLQDDEGISAVLAQASLSGQTLADVIHKHVAYFHQLKPFGETKRYTYKVLAEADFAQKPLHQLTSADILAWFTDRRVRLKSTPATLLQYFGNLRQVLQLAKPTFGVSLSVALIDDIRPTLKAGNMIGQGVERDRRLKPGEYRTLLAWFRKYDATRAKHLKMADLFRFLVRMPLRLGEACRISWSELDTKKRTAMIRDRKDPKNKLGNDQLVPILGRAWRIIQDLPRSSDEDRIFPYREESVSILFAKACEACGIENLHLHDLRHEATSRLFERGYAVQEVALVTGHKSWDMLRRYTQIRPESLHR